MDVTIGDQLEGFVEQIIKTGRYGSASEVVREGLRLIEAREAKLQALRTTLEAAIALGGEISDEALDAALAAKATELRAKGRSA